MIGKSRNNIKGLLWRASCFMMLIVLTGKSYGQTDSCLAVKKDSLSIELTSRLTYHADINVRICYTTQKIIQVHINSTFTRNGKALSEKNLSRRDHQLFLNDVQYNLHDLFLINRDLLDSSDFIPYEIHEQTTISLLMNRNNTYWTGEHLDLILTFLYSIDDDKVEAPFGIVIDLPDHLEKSTVTTPVIGDDPVASRLSQSRRPARTRRTESSNSQEPVIDNACLDSIAYHHRQLLNIYREISENPVIDKSKKRLLRKQFEYHNAKFHALQDSCNLKHSIYNDGYDRVEHELQKHLGSSDNSDLSLSRDKKPASNDVQANQDESGTMDRSKLLNYVLMALLFIVIAYYIFSKIKKKKK